MITKKCLYCGKDFYKTSLVSWSTWNKQKFCSTFCGFQSRQLPLMKKDCLICKKEYLRLKGRSSSWWKNSKYCSWICSAKSKVGKPGSMQGKKHKLETLEKMSKVKLGKSSYWNIGKPAWNKGISHLSKEKHWNWQGGKSKDRHKVNSLEYKKWVKEVFTRDNWICQNCKVRGSYLQAHHIKSWAHYPDLRFEISNGQTLCIPCHKLTYNYKGRNKSKII